VIDCATIVNRHQASIKSAIQMRVFESPLSVGRQVGRHELGCEGSSGASLPADARQTD
jgi:hypothetical protein